MFPFTIRGKVLLGLRREFHLSVAGLEDRMAERLIQRTRRPEMRRDGTTAGAARGFLSAGISRLQSMGFLTTIALRRVSVLFRGDRLYAAYQMDITASTLMSVVIIPLVLGTALIVHSKLSLYQALGVLCLLVLASWGLDITMLVMMVRHEIRQVASEIRAVMLRRDSPSVEAHHRDLEPEILLATAYYYERNGLVQRTEAYLVHLVQSHPDTLEGGLALEHLQGLDGNPYYIPEDRARGEGERRWPARRRWLPGRSGASAGRAAEKEAAGGGRRKRGWRLTNPFGRRQAPSTGGSNGDPAARGPERRRSFLDIFRRGPRRRTGAEGGKPRLFPGGLRGGEPKERRKARKGRERMERKRAESWSPPGEDGGGNGPGRRRRLPELLRLESREERSRRRRKERWFHGPDPQRSAQGSPNGGKGFRRWRPSWLRTGEERQAQERERRWSEGPRGPGAVQRARDRMAKWALERRQPRQERHWRERREKAVEERLWPDDD
ncbi:MAG: hypothetical protein JSV00_01765 [bacterium]|nr:MAG: hypothetical protein JSV00_01765 [bacterium]